MFRIQFEQAGRLRSSRRRRRMKNSPPIYRSGSPTTFSSRNPEIRRAELSNSQQTKPCGHGMKKIDVVRRRIPGIAAHMKPASIDGAELLHAIRALAQLRARLQTQLRQKIV